MIVELAVCKHRWERRLDLTPLCTNCGVRTLQKMRVMVQIRRCLQVSRRLLHVEASGDKIWGRVDPLSGSGVDPQTSR
jgi:DNA-directed RNA polymerase subunit RPC12/RpoP